MKKNTFLVLIMIVILLGGCSLAPEYTRPASPVESEWPRDATYQDVPADPGATLIHELNWREFFTDTRLKQVIETALNNNRDLLVAALNVERARAFYNIQRDELLPTVNAAGSGSKQRLPADLSTTGASMTQERYDVNLGVTAWEIDFFGRIRSLKDKALQDYLATQEARSSAQTTLISSVAQTYLALAADREALELAQATLETQQAAYDLIHQRYEAGIANELDLRQAQTTVDTARRDIAGYLQRLATDENALTLLVGSTVADDLLPESLDSVTPFKKSSFLNMNSEVLMIRPDIIHAEHSLKGAYANIGAARAALFPRISLTTTAGTASSELSGLFESGSRTWSFQPLITVPIFDLRTWSALRVTKVDRKIVLAQYEKAIQTAFREVADALAVRGTINRQISAQSSLVEAVEQTYSLSNKLYIKGIAGYLEVLDAQRSLYEAQIGLISFRLTGLANQVRLYAVLGGGKL